MGPVVSCIRAGLALGSLVLVHKLGGSRGGALLRGGLAASAGRFGLRPRLAALAALDSLAPLAAFAPLARLVCATLTTLIATFRRRHTPLLRGLLRGGVLL